MTSASMEMYWALEQGKWLQTVMFALSAIAFAKQRVLQWNAESFQKIDVKRRYEQQNIR